MNKSIVRAIDRQRRMRESGASLAGTKSDLHRGDRVWWTEVKLVRAGIRIERGPEIEDVELSLARVDLASG